LLRYLTPFSSGQDQGLIKRLVITRKVLVQFNDPCMIRTKAATNKWQTLSMTVIFRPKQIFGAQFHSMTQAQPTYYVTLRKPIRMWFSCGVWHNELAKTKVFECTSFVHLLVCRISTNSCSPRSNQMSCVAQADLTSVLGFWPAARHALWSRRPLGVCLFYLAANPFHRFFLQVRDFPFIVFMTSVFWQAFLWQVGDLAL